MSELPPPVPASDAKPITTGESDLMLDSNQSLPSPPHRRISESIPTIEPFSPKSSLENVLKDESSTGQTDENPIPRSSFLAGIGGAKPNLGGLVMGLNGANKLLKASKRATTFVLKEGSKLSGNHKDWSITPKDRMRNIDELRKHVPTPEECDVLNVPSDRLFVDNIKDVLYLSGGCAGVRFSTAELKSLQSLISNIKDLVKILEKTYAKLTPEQTKLNINPTSSEQIDRSAESASGASNMTVMYFHGVADDLTQLISQLQVVVHEKQKLIDKSAAKMKFENDPDNIPGGMPRPRWLDILMIKCEAYLNHAAPTFSEGGITPSMISRKPLTKGKLSAFISFLCIGALPCTEDEQAALEEVSLCIPNSIYRCWLTY
jgi:hypothetical protein